MNRKVKTCLWPSYYPQFSAFQLNLHRSVWWCSVLFDWCFLPNTFAEQDKCLKHTMNLVVSSHLCALVVSFFWLAAIIIKDFCWQKIVMWQAQLFYQNYRHIITLDWRLLLNALLYSVFPNSLHNSWRNDAVGFI